MNLIINLVTVIASFAVLAYTLYKVTDPKRHYIIHTIVIIFSYAYIMMITEIIKLKGL